MGRERPAGVPEEAFWNADEKEWQVGSYSQGLKKKKRRPVGQWRYWTAGGQLCCIANFDEQGELHGSLERFHPDGTLASRGEWKNGNQRGHFVHVQSQTPTPERYPADERTWRHEFDSENNWSSKNQKWYLFDGTPCTSDGRPLDQAFDLEEHILTAAPQLYLQRHGETISKAFGCQRDEKADIFALEDLWGETFPEVDRLMQFALEGDSFSLCENRRRFEGNIWRSLIEHPWDNQFEELAAAFVGAVRIGLFGDGDGIYATLFQPHRDKGPNAVYVWSHETYYIDDVLADSLDAFAYRTAVACAHEAERISNTTTAQAWQKLLGHVYIWWGLDSGMEQAIMCDAEEADGGTLTKDQFQKDIDPENAVRGFFWRAQWIMHLLAHDNQREWHYVAECFRSNWNPAFDDEAHKERVTWGEKIAPWALYLLWRYFWFNQQERLSHCCWQFRNHRARIVRDLVALIEEINSGNTKLHGIKDILNVREQFLKLDLCPESAGERKEKQATQEHAERQETEQTVASALEAAKSGLAEFLQLAWSETTNPRAMKQLEPIARQFEGYRLQWHALDWIRNNGHQRADQHHEDEAADAAEFIAQEGSAPLQPFLWAGVQTEDCRYAGVLLTTIAKVSDALDRRILPHLLRQLEIAEEYNHKRSLSVNLLKSLRAAEAIPAIMKLTNEFLDSDGDKKDFDARLSMISWKDLLIEVAAFFEHTVIGNAHTTREVIAKLRRLAEHAFATYEYELAAACTSALLAKGDSNLLPFLRKLLADNDDPSRVAALRMLEQLAPDLPGTVRKELLNELRNPDEDCNSVTLMYHRARLALSGTPQLLKVKGIESAFTDSQELSTYGRARWLEWRLIKCETAGRFAEIDLESIGPYVYSSSAELRRGALKAFELRGVAAPPIRVVSRADIWKIEQECNSTIATQVAKSVIELVKDPDAVNKKCLYAWLWEHPLEEAALVLADNLTTRLQHFQAPQSGDDICRELEWLIRALVRHVDFAPVPPVVDKLLQSPEEALLAPVISEIESLPVCFAPQLLLRAVDVGGWQRAAIGNWALTRIDNAEVAIAAKGANIDKRTLKSWTA